MNSLYTAVSLSLINKKRFAIATNNIDQFIPLFSSQVLLKLCQFDEDDIITIDLVNLTSVDWLISHFKLEFKRVIIWKNIAGLSKEQQLILYDFFIQLDNYDTIRGKNSPTCTINGTILTKPDFFLIIPIIDSNEKLFINQDVKERFSFLINYCCKDDSDNFDYLKIIQPSYFSFITELRSKSVFMSPDIKRYIYSLVVFTRQHRLCSLSPRETRLSTRSILEIQLLAKAFTIWNNPDKSNLFVTPDIVKISMRRIGYWLVNWEYNQDFLNKLSDSEELHKKLQINILVGDWYGSDYSCVENYIKLFESQKEKSSPTGWTNKIIEEVLLKVRPPI